MMEMIEDGILIGLVVRDSEVILDFYQNILGMELGRTEPMDEGGTKYYLTFKGGLLKLFAPDDLPEKTPAGVMDHTGYNLLTFVVTNIQDMSALFEEKGVRIITPIQTTDSGTRWMIILDPEDNCIELAQRA